MMPTPQCIEVLPCPKCGLPLADESMTPIKVLRSWRTGESVAWLWRHNCHEIYAEREANLKPPID